MYYVSKVLSNERGQSRCHLAEEKGTIWLSRECTTPVSRSSSGRIGVVVKVLDFQSPDESDQGLSLVYIKIFLLGKKNVKRKIAASLLPPPHTELPDCRLFSLTFESESGKSNRFCGLEASNLVAVHDAPRTLYASARHSAVVSAFDC